MDSQPSPSSKILPHLSLSNYEMEEIEGKQTMIDSRHILFPLYFLNQCRFQRIEFWRNIASALRRETPDFSEIKETPMNIESRFNIFRNMSANHWEEGEITAMWSEAREGRGISWRTIWNYARVDDSDRFKEWLTLRVKTLIIRSLEQGVSESTIAEAVFALFGSQTFFVEKNSTWYSLSDDGSTKMTTCKGDNISLRRSIHSTLLPMCKELRTELSQRAQEAAGAEAKTAEDNVKEMTKLIAKLQTFLFVTKILNYSKIFFADEDAPAFFDENENITAFANCVLEIVGDQVVSREPKLEDYITKDKSCFFDETLNEDSEQVVSVSTWFRKAYPDDELCEYSFKVYASCLKGRNSKKDLYFCAGIRGNNSKSMIMKLLQVTFGDYCIDFPSDVFCGPPGRRTSGPSPEIAQAKGARIAIISELTSSYTMRSGDVKKYTGGDRFFARGCHQDGGSISVMFKPFITCNTMPAIDSIDDAMKARMKIIPHNAQFVDDPPIGETEEETEILQYTQMKFKKEDDFEARIPTLAPAFLWLLAKKYWPMFVREGLPLPKLVVDMNKKYWNMNDTFLRFKLRKIAADPEAKLDIGAAFSEYKSWHVREYPGSSIVNIAQFRTGMTNPDILGPLDDGECWTGFFIDDGISYSESMSSRTGQVTVKTGAAAAAAAEMTKTVKSISSSSDSRQIGE